MEIDTRINALWSVDVLRQFSARTVKENQIDLANKQRWIMKQLAEQYPVVSGALITISGSVRNAATLLEVMIATKMAPVSGLEPASA